MLHDRADVVRGLTFDTDDVSRDATAYSSVQAPKATGPPAAPTTAPRFQRSVSFSAHPQVLELRGSSQEAKGHEGQHSDGQLPFDESKLPDGITAIAVADPNDPSIIVMQVSKLSVAQSWYGHSL